MHFFCPVASQDCSRNFTLSRDRNAAEIDINTTTSFCFIAPVTPIDECRLNGAAVTSSPPAVVFNESNVIINDWTAVNLDNRNPNQLQCELGAPADRETYYANFYSLSKYLCFYIIFFKLSAHLYSRVIFVCQGLILKITDV